MLKVTIDEPAICYVQNTLTIVESSQSIAEPPPFVIIILHDGIKYNNTVSLLIL